VLGGDAHGRAVISISAIGMHAETQPHRQRAAQGRLHGRLGVARMIDHLQRDEVDALLRQQPRRAPVDRLRT
jgi:hypothetical protein